MNDARSTGSFYMSGDSRVIQSFTTNNKKLTTHLGKWTNKHSNTGTWKSYRSADSNNIYKAGSGWICVRCYYKYYWACPRTDGDADLQGEKASSVLPVSGGFDSTGNFLIH
jgi:hypothetical protein